MAITTCAAVSRAPLTSTVCASRNFARPAMYATPFAARLRAYIALRRATYASRFFFRADQSLPPASAAVPIAKP